MNQEIRLSKNATIWIMADTAYRDFEKTPRKRCASAMNILFAKAKERGYGAADNFKTCFRNPTSNREQERQLVEELAEFMSIDDIQMAFSYVAAA